VPISLINTGVVSLCIEMSEIQENRGVSHKIKQCKLELQILSIYAEYSANQGEIH